MKKAKIVIRWLDERSLPPGLSANVVTEDGREYMLTGVKEITKRMRANDLIALTVETMDFEDDVVTVERGERDVGGKTPR